jgi:hypothetical protein
VLPLPRKVVAPDGAVVRVETKQGYLRDSGPRTLGRHYGSPGNRRNRVVVSTMQPPGSARETLWHELLHDCLARAGTANSKLVERVLDSLDGWSLDLLRANPELRAFLFEEAD